MGNAGCLSCLFPEEGAGDLGGVNTGVYGVPIRQCKALGGKKKAYTSPDDEEVDAATFPPFSFKEFESINCKWQIYK